MLWKQVFKARRAAEKRARGARMATQVGNAADRVYESLAFEFMREVERSCDLFATLCESPIEVMIGATLWVSARLHNKQDILVLADGFKDEHRDKIVIVPQCCWGSYRFDFGMRWYGEGIVFIECDGHDFHSTKEQIQRDREKDRKVQDAGYAILRFTGAEIYRDPAECALQILGFLTKKSRENRE